MPPSHFPEDCRWLRHSLSAFTKLSHFDKAPHLRVLPWGSGSLGLQGFQGSVEGFMMFAAVKNVHLSGWLLAYDSFWFSTGGSSSIAKHICCKYFQAAGIVVKVLQMPSQVPEEGTRQTVCKASTCWLI